MEGYGVISWADVAGELWPGEPGYRRPVSPWILQQAEAAARGALAEDREEIIRIWIDALETEV